MSKQDLHHVSLLRQDIWAIKLRYFWLGIQTLLILLALSYGYLTKTTFSLIFLINLLFILINRKLHLQLIKGRHSKTFYNYHFEADLVVFVTFLILSGGSQNPFYPFYFILVFLIGLHCEKGQSWPKALVVVAASFALEISPYLGASVSILSKQTIPYLVIQFSIPLIIFFIGQSLGGKLQNAYAALERFKRKEEKISRLKALGALSAGLSHEFASPLHAAQLRLERLQRKIGPDEDLDECLLALSDCSDTLHLMNKVHRDLDSTQFEVINEKDLQKFITQWSQEFPEVSLKIDLRPFEVHCPKLSFVQALINLLDNARQSQGDHPEIWIKAQNKNITIKDRGPGFPEHVLGRIGEPFNTSRPGGTGLGLYSTELFMNSVGAEMRIKSTEQGATVELDFV